MNVDHCPACKRPFEERRTLDQNALMWSRLRDISRQVVWHGLKLSEHDWKEMFTAGLRRQRVVPGLDGGFVILGASTSRMTKAEMNEMIEFCLAFGAQHDVKWSQPDEEA